MLPALHRWLTVTSTLSSHVLLILCEFLSGSNHAAAAAAAAAATVHFV